MKPIVSILAANLLATASYAGVIYDNSDLSKIVATNAARFERDYQGEAFAARLPFNNLSRAYFSKHVLADFGAGGMLPNVQCRVFDEKVVQR